jgi:F420H(2)-dependent quinone reductase
LHSSPGEKDISGGNIVKAPNGSGPKAYLRPSWFNRRIIAAVPGADRLAAGLASGITGDSVLQVTGRRTGRVRTTLARPITVGGRRYLVAIRGETQWARNLRASRTGILRERGESTLVSAVEVHGDERRAVVEAFVASSKYAPTRRIMTNVLPDPDQHPVFRIEPLP